MSDFFINLGKIKTNTNTTITGCLKNMFGLIPTSDKKYFHPFLSKVLVDINKLIKSDLCILESGPAMEGNGPVRGSGVDTQAVLASTDFIAADIIGAELMGFNPENIGYLQYAAGRDGFRPLGVGDREKITLVGTPLETLRRKFRPHDSYRAQLAWHIPESMIPTMKAALNITE